MGCRTVEIELDYQPVCRGWMTTTGVEARHAHHAIYPGKASQYGPIEGLLQFASEVSAEAYMHVELDRRFLAVQLDAIFNEVGFILCPSMTTYGEPRERDSLNGSSDDTAAIDMTELTKFTAPFNYSIHPSLSLPWRALRQLRRHHEQADVIQHARGERMIGDSFIIEHLGCEISRPHRLSRHAEACGVQSLKQLCRHREIALEYAHDPAHFDF